MNDFHSAIYFIQEVIKLNPQHDAARDMLAEYRGSLKRQLNQTDAGKDRTIQ